MTKKEPLTIGTMKFLTIVIFSLLFLSFFSGLYLVLEGHMDKTVYWYSILAWFSFSLLFLYRMFNRFSSQLKESLIILELQINKLATENKQLKTVNLVLSRHDD